VLVEEGVAPELSGDARVMGRCSATWRYSSLRTHRGTARLEVKSYTGSSEEAWAPATALGAAALAGTTPRAKERAAKG
jgi:hypothetical protein